MKIPATKRSKATSSKIVKSLEAKKKTKTIIMARMMKMIIKMIIKMMITMIMKMMIMMTIKMMITMTMKIPTMKMIRTNRMMM